MYTVYFFWECYFREDISIPGSVERKTVSVCISSVNFFGNIFRSCGILCVMNEVFPKRRESNIVLSRVCFIPASTFYINVLSKERKARCVRRRTSDAFCRVTKSSCWNQQLPRRIKKSPWKCRDPHRHVSARRSVHINKGILCTTYCFRDCSNMFLKLMKCVKVNKRNFNMNFKTQ